MSGEQQAVSSSEHEKPHQCLLAWQRSMDLFVEVHRLTARLAALVDEALRLTYGLKRSL